MTTQIKSTYNLKYSPDVFTTRESAFRSADRSVKMAIVILGEAGKFWVVCMADAQRLVKQGFEPAI
jgi:hypothetical protein